MDNRELADILSSDPMTHTLFLGVFPSDRIPRVRKRPCCFILNTDPSFLPGTHWVAIFIDLHKTEFFDSYGLKPADYHLNLSVDSWNTKRVQHYAFQSCGLHCLFFVLHRARYFSMDYIMKVLYSDHLLLNETIVLKDVLRHLLMPNVCAPKRSPTSKPMWPELI